MITMSPRKIHDPWCITRFQSLKQKTWTTKRLSSASQISGSLASRQTNFIMSLKAYALNGFFCVDPSHHEPPSCLGEFWCFLSHNQSGGQATGWYRCDRQGETVEMLCMRTCVLGLAAMRDDDVNVRTSTTNHREPNTRKRRCKFWVIGFISLYFFWIWEKIYMFQIVLIFFKIYDIYYF